jgi:hypothetical protein
VLSRFQDGSVLDEQLSQAFLVLYLLVCFSYLNMWLHTNVLN